MSRLIEVSAADGHTTQLEVFGSADSPAALFLPGLGVPISYYEPFLAELASAGLCVYGLELRGMPHSSITNVRRTDFGYHHALFYDIPAALAALPAPPAALVGHSLGGQLALLYAASTPDLTVPLITIASGSSLHTGVSGRRGQRIRRRQAAAIPLIARGLGYFPGDRLGFGGRQPVSMMRDWAFEAKHGRYELVGSAHDFEAGLASVANPTLMITLEGDRLISRAAAALLGDRLDSAVPTMTHLDGERFDHFRWARRQPEIVAQAASRWLGTSTH
jgi:predicted alpha/beta hydrolase